jgi:putative transposase
MFGRWDLALAEVKGGPEWLLQPEIAAAVVQSIRRVEDRLYTLEAYCVMPNHVHVVLTPRFGDDGQYHALAKITQAIKGSSATEANRLLNRSGQFWQHESYDHVVRDGEELDRVVRYVLGNPVKASLVDDWRAWPWGYTRLTPHDL